jgi:DUF2924 family protein
MGDDALTRKPSPKLAPGSRLVREWQSPPSSVEVTEDGFIYAGQR